jgi:tetratricopeptide (TPR) repeat protein
LGEIYERFYNDWQQGEKYYLTCSETDPDRADSWFYIGQHYRLRNDIERSLPYLLKAAQLPIPERSLFQWHYLYYCLVPLMRTPIPPIPYTPPHVIDPHSLLQCINHLIM